MSAIRQLLVSTLIFAAVPPAAVRAAESAEYVGGTVKSIPVNSTGTLSFDDAKELRFNYSGSVYSVPYGNIANIEIDKAETRHLFGRIPMPALLHPKEVLSITYKDASGAVGAVNFEVSSFYAQALQANIQDRIDAPKKAAAPDDDPFVDRYWRTTRNQAHWDAKEAQNAQNAQNAQSAPATSTPAGTK
ncbi:MAG TPA: hypothetical protein VMB25_14910 [Bryobacteraceae bacterium]|nr:hypothetical protein [Bryobacteraceae bacterium]